MAALESIHFILLPGCQVFCEDLIYQIHLCASEYVWGHQHCNLHILSLFFFSDRKCDFAHANTLTFHLVYIQGYNTVLPNSVRFVTICHNGAYRHQVFIPEVN